ncbi:aminotransferase class I/II-fold pyridoxal phosphate-dependent enzyme [Prescottella defluvii]|nr:aminotransferase class I/II-fold pyridoxal phosphate-dependent enzyme [Prescottella defluvii]
MPGRSAAARPLRRGGPARPGDRPDPGDLESDDLPRPGDPSLLGELDELDPSARDVFGPYEKLLADGRRLSSVSAVLRGPDGEASAVLCVNLDRTPLEQAAAVLSAFGAPSVARPESLFEQDWNERIQHVVGEYVRERGRPVERLTRADRLALLGRLDEANVFAVRRATPVVAAALRVSRLHPLRPAGRTQSTKRKGLDAMTRLPDFRLETYFSRWEFTAQHHMAASDAQSMTLGELLALADDQDRAAFENLSLGYTETFGDPALREVIAGTYERVDAADVICFAGAEEAIYLAMNVLLDAGDHAVVVTPNYQSAETVPLALCEVTGVALDPDHDWALDLDEVKAAIRPNTRVISANFPDNPTGKVISAADFTELARLCDERGIYLFSDEVYRGLERDPARTLPQAADLSARALSLNVTSKSLGLPGLRIGWITCRDRALLSRLERAKHYTTICNSAPSEVLARIALEARTTILERNRALIAANLPVFDALFSEFADAFEWQAPDGGCVAYPRYLGSEGVEEFCTRLVEESGVLLLPASMYRSELTPTPADRFRIGVGRRNSEDGLAVFAQWMRGGR